MRPQVRHYLAENEAERSPRRLIFWDTEGEPVGDGRTHALRLWCANSALRKGITPKLPRQELGEGRGAAALCEWIVSRAKTDTPLWICSHGSSYDLTITRLPLQLLELGWELGQHALTGGEPWAHFRQGHKSIHLIDSHSFLPQSLEQIGDALGLPKLPLPEFMDDDETWFARCRRDVEILSAAMLQLLDWWDRERLGSFADTGPGTGWHAMRHRPAADQVLIDPDPEGRAWDRQAIYGGRRDCWQKGHLPEGWYVDLDLVQAHLSICATQALPVRRTYQFDSMPLDTHLLDHIGAGIIAEAEIETDTPRYPLRLNGAITYPVGRFRTVLCSPELSYARELGELRAIGPGRRYRLGYAMENWAHWIQRILAGEELGTPPAALIAAKGWSRTVVGRWAMRTGRQDFELPSHEPGWGVRWGRDHETNSPRTILDMGGREIWLVQDQESDSSFPAVLAWVQSWTRVLLDRLITALGPRTVIVANTDGVIVRGKNMAMAGDWLLPVGDDYTLARRCFDAAALRLTPVTRPVGLQVKAVYRQAEVIGPQHLILDRQRRLSGVRAKAEEIRPKVYAYETWPRLAAQMAMGDPAGYRFGDAAVDLSNVHVPRWEFEDGCCEPPRLSLRPLDKHWVVWPQPRSCWPHHSPAQAAQHPALQSALAWSKGTATPQELAKVM